VRALEKHNTSLHGVDLCVAIERAAPAPRVAMPDPLAALVRPVAGLAALPHPLYAQVARAARLARAVRMSEPVYAAQNCGWIPCCTCGHKSTGKRREAGVGGGKGGWVGRRPGSR
jgi:hypothetical protein